MTVLVSYDAGDDLRITSRSMILRVIDEPSCQIQGIMARDSIH